MVLGRTRVLILPAPCTPRTVHSFHIPRLTWTPPRPASLTDRLWPPGPMCVCQGDLPLERPTAPHMSRTLKPAPRSPWAQGSSGGLQRACPFSSPPSSPASPSSAGAHPPQAPSPTSAWETSKGHADVDLRVPSRGPWPRSAPVQAALHTGQWKQLCLSLSSGGPWMAGLPGEGRRRPRPSLGLPSCVAQGAPHPLSAESRGAERLPSCRVTGRSEVVNAGVSGPGLGPRERAVDSGRHYEKDAPKAGDRDRTWAAAVDVSGGRRDGWAGVMAAWVKPCQRHGGGSRMEAKEPVEGRPQKQGRGGGDRSGGQRCPQPSGREDSVCSLTPGPMVTLSPQVPEVEAPPERAAPGPAQTGTGCHLLYGQPRAGARTSSLGSGRGWAS